MYGKILFRSLVLRYIYISSFIFAFGKYFCITMCLFQNERLQTHKTTTFLPVNIFHRMMVFCCLLIFLYFFYFLLFAITKIWSKIRNKCIANRRKCKMNRIPLYVFIWQFGLELQNRPLHP